MTLPPLVARELRGAARRRSTKRLRWWAAFLALVLSLGVMVATSISGGLRGQGLPLFRTLTGYAFLLSLLFGVLLTADAIAREKREGTLGLLLLTDLRSSNIVLEKCLAHSINAFYALLAVVPAAALPFVMGGVGAGEFVRMALVLLNTLVLSLAMGIFVSALCRETQNAMGNGLGLVILLTVILPGSAMAFRSLGLPSAWQVAGWFSPAFTYMHATGSSFGAAPRLFWMSLGLSHLLAWGFLAAATWSLPRGLQAGPTAPSRKLQTRPSNRPRPLKWRPDLLSKDPVLWLRRGDIRTPWSAWLIVILWAVVVLVISLMPTGIDPVLQVQFASPFAFFLKLLFAVETCRFFVESRHNGTLELLLCTPLSNQAIIQGQMKALARAYAWPFVALLLLTVLPVLWKFEFNFSQGPFHVVQDLGKLGFTTGALIVRLVADVLAILWLGTAVALTSKRPGLAPAWTVLLVLVLPAPLSFCFFDLFLDLIFISWGTNKCRLDLRRLVAEQYQAFSEPERLTLAPWHS